MSNQSKGPVGGGPIRSVRLRRYAIDQVVALTKDTDDAATRDRFAQRISEIAVGSSTYGRLVYRMIAIALGLVAVLVVVFAFALLLGKHTVDAAFYTLGSAAVGALGGVFAPGGGGSSIPSPGESGQGAPVAPGGEDNPPAP